MENNLSKKLGLPYKTLPEYKIMKLEDIHSAHLDVSFIDDDDSKEIKSILKELYNKIEDQIHVKSEQEKFHLEQEKMKAQAQFANTFTPNQPATSG